MPIGVPKVPCRLSEGSRSDWVDVYNILSRERVLFLIQSLDDKIVNQIVRLLLYLSCERGEVDISLYVNFSGGSGISGLSLVDTIQYIKADVSTINVGLATSIATFVIARGKRGKRFSLPYARFMVHQSDEKSQGSATNIFSESKETIRLRRCISQLYVTFTEQLVSRIIIDLDRGEFLNARQACEYGIIDLVSRNVAILL
jgi:ATP-dependent Clp protease protease subunit